MKPEGRRASFWIRTVLGVASWIGTLAAPPALAQEDAASEVVILLHGLGRTDRSMRKLETRLARAGYAVRNLRYPSRQAAPDALVESLHAQLVACCDAAERVHFVTHSLGGILLRAYLTEHELPRLGRVVMVAPPNHGSEYVDLLRDWQLFRWVFGPTVIELGTDPNSLPNRLPGVTFELGVIAGTTGLNPLSPFVVSGENDGTVSVESARIAGMRDFVAIPASHSFIMYSDLAIELSVAFLRDGRFAATPP
jgi:triacylglycerol lipase